MIQSTTNTLKRDYLTIVSGLPRSGTSMMMRMLDSAGMPVLKDEIREADEDNPRGYYEFEVVKKTSEDSSWLEGSEGKAVKMIYRLLYDLPTDRKYRVLFMRRNMNEILASQQKMLERNNLAGGGPSDEEMSKLFESQILSFQDWVKKQSHIEIMEVHYNQIMSDPTELVDTITDFLDGELDGGAMCRVVDPELYRNRV